MFIYSCTFDISLYNWHILYTRACIDSLIHAMLFDMCCVGAKNMQYQCTVHSFSQCAIISEPAGGLLGVTV